MADRNPSHDAPINFRDEEGSRDTPDREISTLSSCFKVDQEVRPVIPEVIIQEEVELVYSKFLLGE
ncbi:hypothetical protein [Arthrobacter sp. CAL618]|uniref:hypothetical protein n=1 Tax=Arthrobacter sp. CAL618 TaxID=1055770 RepID=UPI0006869030|nr:hypothetical protein [Arthrobacter sp. CAL618]